MSFILGMDTGGTYTDAVVIDAKDRRVICKAKALTTKDDLTRGIKGCLEQLEFDRMDEITMISLSTTLATNAIVEGRGGKVALLYMGADLDGEIPSAESIRIKVSLILWAGRRRHWMKKKCAACFSRLKVKWTLLPFRDMPVSAIRNTNRKRH